MFLIYLLSNIYKKKMCQEEKKTEYCELLLQSEGCENQPQDCNNIYKSGHHNKHTLWCV